jgi:hypothetical protein
MKSGDTKMIDVDKLLNMLRRSASTAGVSGFPEYQLLD